MKQWDIMLFPFPGIGAHPAVVISPDEHCRNPQAMSVNALACTSLRSGAEPRPIEVRLDAADGLDWATVVRCNFFYSLPKTSFGRVAGCVSLPRRRAIARKVIDCFKLEKW